MHTANNIFERVPQTLSPAPLANSNLKNAVPGHQQYAGILLTYEAPPPGSTMDAFSKVDLYSILARAPPAELGSKAPGLSDGAGKPGATTIPEKAGKQKRERGSSRNCGGIGGKREQRTIQTVAPTPPRGGAGGYLVRDPLGDEVAELDAKVQENLRR